MFHVLQVAFRRASARSLLPTLRTMFRREPGEGERWGRSRTWPRSWVRGGLDRESIARLSGHADRVAGCNGSGDADSSPGRTSHKNLAVRAQRPAGLADGADQIEA